jgi:hypothetical protein
MVPQVCVSRCASAGSSSLDWPKSAILQTNPLPPSSRLLSRTLPAARCQFVNYVHSEQRSRVYWSCAMGSRHA